MDDETDLERVALAEILKEAKASEELNKPDINYCINKRLTSQNLVSTLRHPIIPKTMIRKRLVMGLDDESEHEEEMKKIKWKKMKSSMSYNPDGEYIYDARKYFNPEKFREIVAYRNKQGKYLAMKAQLEAYKRKYCNKYRQSQSCLRLSPKFADYKYTPLYMESKKIGDVGDEKCDQYVDFNKYSLYETNGDDENTVLTLGHSSHKHKRKKHKKRSNKSKKKSIDQLVAGVDSSKREDKHKKHKNGKKNKRHKKHMHKENSEKSSKAFEHSCRYRIDIDVPGTNISEIYNLDASYDEVSTFVNSNKKPKFSSCLEASQDLNSRSFTGDEDSSSCSSTNKHRNDQSNYTALSRDDEKKYSDCSDVAEENSSNNLSKLNNCDSDEADRDSIVDYNYLLKLWKSIDQPKEESTDEEH